MRPLVLPRGLATRSWRLKSSISAASCSPTWIASGPGSARSRRHEALEALPLETTRAFNPTEPWLADALPELAPIDITGEDEAAAQLHSAGFHFRRATHAWFLASTGHLAAAMDYRRTIRRCSRRRPGIAGGIRPLPHSPTTDSASLMRPWAGRRRRDGRGQARELFAEFDHHILVAFTLLNELHDVVMTYGAADPAARRQLAAEAEAALGRAGGALRPGVSPRLARLACLVLDGQWVDASQSWMICRRLGTRTCGGRSRARSACSAATAANRNRLGANPYSLSSMDRPPSPATTSTRKGSSCSAWQLTSASTLVIFRNARAWLEAHGRWLAWSGSVLGRADGALAWARYHQVAR